MLNLVFELDVRFSNSELISNYCLNLFEIEYHSLSLFKEMHLKFDLEQPFWRCRFAAYQMVP
jgi:hypothetical protein